ncbi:MAG: cytochrome ubiquinol oxidase subunit I, partial [Polyangiales bacterium]
AARAQMEVSLGFHMIFAALGIGMPFLMVIAEGLYLRTGREHYRDLAKKWGKITALLFVIGAVSGTALSFELGLLWPRFMAFSGNIIGPAFALEGYAFFLEAIFIELYLYGWERLSPRTHWLTGIPVALSGMLSGAIVVGANAWMQVPHGFERIEGGRPVGIDPWAPFTGAWLRMAVHSTLSCYIAVGFCVAGVYAVGLLRGRRNSYHRTAITIALAVGTVAALLQPLSGDRLAKGTARDQPEKLAAAEAHFETTRDAPLVVGGIPDAKTGEVRFGLKIPYGLSFLAHGDPHAEVKGLNDYAPEDRPNPVVVHLAFEVMVGGGMTVLAVGLLFFLVRWRKKSIEGRWLLWLVALTSPLGMIALEAGWLVTEAGRQPWTIHGIMRTRDAVTTSSDVGLTFFVFSALYLGLGVTLVVLLRRTARDSDHAPPSLRPARVEGGRLAR